MSQTRLSLSWHIGNAAAGASVTVLLFIVTFFALGFITGQPDLMSKKLSLPLFAIYSTVTIVWLAKRVARRITQSIGSCFIFFPGFHISNVLLAWLLAFFLFLIPVFGILVANPRVSPWILALSLWLAFIVVLFLVLFVVSKRSEKHVIRNIATESTVTGEQ
jgi:Ca2+/Na+ antiporter